ncbi:MAG TPA: hypothetical protein PLO37_18425 [Candidatus Hydrogenedentes bacterium]|nr:hypothetical protein [Candidatus Hydrogenedentota bacterium]HPG68828.1 hypothetical protein [Candidatus Hydrogenedentota bacterium]
MYLCDILIVLLCALWFAAPIMSDDTGICVLRAGVAKSDITTNAEGVRINDPLYAKVLVLDDGTTRLAIIAMDVTAIGGIGEIGDDFLPALRARIETELGIPGRHVLVNASHNHPPGRLLCEPAEQLERTFDAVKRAAESMTAVKVGAGVGRETRISMNRTLRLNDGKAWTIRHTNPCPPDDEVEGVGPIDPEIGILRVDRVDGRPLALVYNFACHPYLTVPRGGVTADFPGFASAVIEKSLGDGAMALFLQGAGGDITEVLYKDVHRPRDSEPLGTMLGLSTLEGWRGIETKDARLSVISEDLQLPRKADFDERIAELEGEQAALLKSLRGTSLNLKTFVPLYIQYALDSEHPFYYSYRYLHSEAMGTDELSAIDAQNRAQIDKYVCNIRAMEKLARIQDKIATLEKHKAATVAAGEPTMTTEVQGMKIGDFVLITSAAEVGVEVGLNVKEASPHEFTFMAAYSNGYIQYGPPSSEYLKGGYEVTECLLAPEWQAIYEEKADEILRALE